MSLRGKDSISVVKLYIGLYETKFARATGSDKEWQKSSAETTGASLLMTVRRFTAQSLSHLLDMT